MTEPTQTIEVAIEGSPWPEVKNWLQSLGTAFPLPMPKSRKITEEEPYNHGPCLPLMTPFRDRLYAAQHKEWVLLDGRLLDQPLTHRVPSNPFESNHFKRLDRCKFDIWLSTGANALRNHRFLKRKAQLRWNREPRFWWGRLARMRLGDRQFWRLSEYDRKRYLARLHRDKPDTVMGISVGSTQSSH